MQRWEITSDTKTQGRITKNVPADSYMDAMRLMDLIVDELDGFDIYNQGPPMTLTLDELESGYYGEYHNFHLSPSRWHYVLKTGWFYTGSYDDGEDSEIGRRCGALDRLDSVYMH